MTRLVIVGVDPGPTPGVVALEYVTPNSAIGAPSPTLMEIHVVQCSANALTSVLSGVNLTLDGIDHVAAEQFVVGRRSGRSGSAGAGATTRDQVGQLQLLFPRLALRNASQVKGWASDERLEAAGLLDATKGLRHARDAGRHALFAACRDLGMPDPLSTTNRTTDQEDR